VCFASKPLVDGIADARTFQAQVWEQAEAQGGLLKHDIQLSASIVSMDRW